MGFLDWLFGHHQEHAGDDRLRAIVDKVIEATDPRLKAVSHARERLLPAVEHALDFAHALAAGVPESLELTPDNWVKVPLLKAMFVRPTDIAETLATSSDLRDFLAAEQSQGLERIHCVFAATCTERTVLGMAMDGDMLRQDVAQKTVGFGDFRLVGFSPSDAALRERVEEIVLEGLVLAALKAIAENRQHADQLTIYRQLLLTRLRLMEQSCVGMNSMLADGARENRDIDQLRRELAANEAALSSLKAESGGFDSVLDHVSEVLHNAETVIDPHRVFLHLNAMNIIVDAGAADASTIELLEIATLNPQRPRRVAFFATFPRGQVVERHLDFDAMLRSL